MQNHDPGNLDLIWGARNIAAVIKRDERKTHYLLAIDCLLLDIQLAGASGIELRNHLEACGFKLPVIFMTGLDDEALHRQALNACCVALLHKPFLEHQLIDAIEKAVP
jgi:FixJ family two-component response regulator